jgi:hypothetical protein
MRVLLTMRTQCVGWAKAPLRRAHQRYTAFILRSALLRASRRMGQGARPSFETPRKRAAPQDEGRMVGTARRAPLFAHPTVVADYAAAFFLALISLRLIRHSAIWIAFSAAPLRRLSDTHHSTRPFSTVASSRMRLM